MSGRSDWVDYAKAIGIILVVYGHVARGLFNAGIALPESLYYLADSIIYSFHMPLFFFLSGLFFYSSFERRGPKKLVFNKVDTIFYPYLLWSLLQGGAEVFLSSYTNGNVTVGEVASLLWEPRAQFWFLYALFLIFIVSAVIFRFVDRRYSPAVFSVAVGLYLLPWLLPDLSAMHFISQNGVFFIFGMLFTQFAKMDRYPPLISLAILFSLFVIGQWIFHGYYVLNYTDKGIGSLLLALISILFVVAVSRCLAAKPIAALVFIGQSSMAIYLMHILAGSGARVVLEQYLHVQSPWLHLSLGCVIAIAAPLIALLIIQKLHIPFVFSAPIVSRFQFVK